MDKLLELWNTAQATVNGGYPVWKTWVWRYVRSFVATAIAAGCTSAVVALQAFKIDINKPQETLTLLFFILLVSFITGFLNALGKAIRDTFSESKDSRIEKLPI